MNNASTSSSKREPLFALSLSLVCPGAGHLYCGRVVAALMIFLGSLSFTSVAAVAAFLQPRLSTFVLITATFTFVVLYVYAAFSATRAARRSKEYALQPFNHGLVYFFLVVAGSANPVVGTILLRASVFEAFYIPTQSMAPTIMSGDRILVNKVNSRGRLPERGQLIVFRSPHDRKRMFVKRVIGLPGDRVEIQGDDVLLNGRKLVREQLPKEGIPAPNKLLQGELFEEQTGNHRYTILIQPGKAKRNNRIALDEDEKQKDSLTVPAGHCYVLGDNRSNSRDSRAFSFVPLGDIEGRVQTIFYPAHTWRRFGTPR